MPANTAPARDHATSTRQRFDRAIRRAQLCRLFPNSTDEEDVVVHIQHNDEQEQVGRVASINVDVQERTHQ